VKNEMTFAACESPRYSAILRWPAGSYACLARSANPVQISDSMFVWLVVSRGPRLQWDRISRILSRSCVGVTASGSGTLHCCRRESRQDGSSLAEAIGMMDTVLSASSILQRCRVRSPGLSCGGRMFMAFYVPHLELHEGVHAPFFLQEEDDGGFAVAVEH